MTNRLFNGFLRAVASAGLLAGGLGWLSAPASAQDVTEAVPPITGDDMHDAPGQATLDGVLNGCGSCDACDGCDSCEVGCCNLGDPWTLSSALCGDDPAFTIGGWTQFGYHTKSTGMFNNVPNDINLHQQWLYIEKVADGECGMDWGFRFDLMYGVDGTDTQAFGNPPGTWDFQNGFDHGIYSWALPQLYLEVASGDWSIKAGHFYTLVGYEVVTAPDNFFYSHAFTFFFNEPFTHTGVLGTYNASDDVTLYGGLTAGWDTGFERFNDGDNSDGSNFLGGVSLTLAEDSTLTYILTAGDFGTRGEGYSHSIVLATAFAESWEYVFQSDLVETNTLGDHQFSINQYLFYTINDCLKAGVRAEWWQNDDVDLYEVTTGINIRPHANLIFRPEVRWQWSEDNEFVDANGPVPVGDTIFGIDAILTY